MHKDLKHMHMWNNALCHININVLLFVPCSAPVALEMEAPDDYCASKSLYCLHIRFSADTDWPMLYDQGQNLYNIFKKRSVFCWADNVDNVDNNVISDHTVCFWDFDVINLFSHDFHSFNADTKYFCNHNIINIARDFPLVQLFSCSPLKGRENDALATSCSMQQILDMHFVVLHCPLLVSFGQVSWISSLPLLYFALVCIYENR